jgi:predicted lipid-binding transport protein (Tim44 family)
MSSTDGSDSGAEPAPGERDGTIDRVAHRVMNTIQPGYDDKVHKIFDDMDAEAAADKIMLDTEERSLAERPPATAPDVDLTAVRTAVPTFDEQAFLTIARECFERVRTARSKDDPQFTDAELSPQLVHDLHDAIAGDVASHRHHLLPGLEIRNAVIVSAGADAAAPTLVVRFHLEASEVDLGANDAVVAGDYTEREWDEDWTFTRDPSVDSPQVDSALTFVPLDAGGWLIAHEGWIVTAINRVGAPDPLDPSNL